MVPFAPFQPATPAKEEFSLPGLSECPRWPGIGIASEDKESWISTRTSEILLTLQQFGSAAWNAALDVS